MNINTISFASNLVPLILDGSKTLTYRLGEKYASVEIGDILSTKDSSTGEVFAKIEITLKEKGTFATLRDDREGHEVYRTPEERRATFERYYNRPVSDDEPVIILGFKLLRQITGG